MAQEEHWKHGWANEADAGQVWREEQAGEEHRNTRIQEGNWVKIHSTNPGSINRRKQKLQDHDSIRRNVSITSRLVISEH